MRKTSVIYVSVGILIAALFLLSLPNLIGNLPFTSGNKESGRYLSVSSYDFEFNDIKGLMLKDITVFGENVYLALVVMNRSGGINSPELMVYDVSNTQVIYRARYPINLSEADAVFLESYLLFVRYYPANGTILKAYDLDEDKDDLIMLYEGKKLPLHFVKYGDGFILTPSREGVWIENIYYIYVEDGELRLDSFPLKYVEGTLLAGFGDKPIFVDLVSWEGILRIKIDNKIIELEAEETPFIGMLGDKYLAILRYYSSDQGVEWVLTVVNVEVGVITQEIPFEHRFVAVAGHYQDSIILYAGDSDSSSSDIYSKIYVYRYSVGDGALERLLEYSYESDKYLIWWVYPKDDRLIIYGRYAAGASTEGKSTLRLYEDGTLLDEIPASRGLPVKYKVYDSGNRVVLAIVYLDLIDGYGSIALYDIDVSS